MARTIWCVDAARGVTYSVGAMPQNRIDIEVRAAGRDMPILLVLEHAEARDLILAMQMAMGDGSNSRITDATPTQFVTSIPEARRLDQLSDLDDGVERDDS